MAMLNNQMVYVIIWIIVEYMVYNDNVWYMDYNIIYIYTHSIWVNYNDLTVPPHWNSD